MGSKPEEKKNYRNLPMPMSRQSDHQAVEATQLTKEVRLRAIQSHSLATPPSDSMHPKFLQAPKEPQPRQTHPATTLPYYILPNSSQSLVLLFPPTVRITMFCARCFRGAAVARRQLPISRHAFSSSSLRFYSAAEPQLSTPATDAGDASKPGSATTTSSRSICPEGTVLTGLNYIKGGQDPVALKDEEYPEWLWSCLDVMKKADAADDNLGDEFCTF